jgi:hypothetical protein
MDQCQMCGSQMRRLLCRAVVDKRTAQLMAITRVQSLPGGRARDAGTRAVGA